MGFTQEQKELLLNGGFESGVAKWKSYCDAAGITPVDGVGGGVAGFAISASTTSPLAGKSSGIITKDAANRQGCGVATDFTVQEENKAQVLQVKIPYKVTSGTYADDQYKVYVYDIDNATMIEVAPTFIKNSSIKETYRGTFQTSLTGVNYRLIIHNASTSAVASTMKIEGNVSSQLVGTGSFQTDWKNYPGSPTFTNVNLGTGGTSYFQYKELGDSIIIRAGFVLGTGGSLTGTLQIPIPSGMLIDYTGIQAINACGTAYSVDTGSNRPSGTIVTGNGANHLRVTGAQLGASGLEWGTSVPFTWANTYSFNFTSDPIKIQGKTSNTVLSSEYDTRPIAFRARKSSQSGLTAAAVNTITFSNSDVSFDDAGAWNGSDTYIVKSPSKYRISASVAGNTTGAATQYVQVLYRINGGSDVPLHASVNGNGANPFASGDDLVNLKSGDTIQMRVLPSVDTTINIPTFKIERVGSGSVQVAASEDCGVAASHGAGSSLASAGSTIVFENEEFDKCGEYDPSTGIFQPRNSGEYEIIYNLYSVNFTDSVFDSGIYKNVSTLVRRDDMGTKHPTLTRAQSKLSTKLKLLSSDNIRIKNISAHAGQNLYTADSFISIKRVGNY